VKGPLSQLQAGELSPVGWSTMRLALAATVTR
jgi:hypothetical protein